MTAVSHVQNNQLAPIALKCTKVNKLINDLDDEDYEKAQKRKELIKKQGDLFTPYNKFIDSLTSLFCSFKSDEEVDNSKTINYLKFILELVFYHGLNIKYSHINISVNIFESEEVGENTKILLFENIIIAAVWTLIENAIEAYADEVSILIKNNNNNVEILVTNNGEKIIQDHQKHIFTNFFGTKDRSGLGLSISKNWLKQINNDIELQSSTSEETIFKIKIPINKEEY
jgi:signal transduction histidine kinase